MVRRKSAGVSVAIDGDGSARSADVSTQLASITASLKQGLSPSPRGSENSQGPRPAAIPATSGNPRVLVYFEAAPSAGEQEFLLKMFSAIQIGPDDLAIEYGDFPEARAAVALGFGLAARKSARLVALRPDRFEFPALGVIQNDPNLKREAWEKLKQVAARLRELG